jgi:c-di-GMP-related signal transduction protein
MRTVLNKKYFLDGMLIVFSVLFTLFINKLAENVKISNDKKIALENVKNELQRNAAVLHEWIIIHKDVRNKISNLVEGKNDSLKTELLKFNYLNIGLLTDGRSLVSNNLSKTALGNS